MGAAAGHQNPASSRILEGETMKLGFIGAGFIARFQSVAIHQVRGLEIAGLLRRRG